MSQYSASDERDLGTFIPSFLDDYGLTSDEFRIYAHVARRAGSGTCWESVGAIAKICKMDIKTVRKVLAVLKIAGLLDVEDRPGKTTLYRLTKHSLWVHPDRLNEIRESITSTKSGTTKSGRGTVLGTTKQHQDTPTVSGGTPLPETVPEGSPIREYQEGIPLSLAESEKNNPPSALEPAIANQPTSFSVNQNQPTSKQEPEQDQDSVAPNFPKKENYIHPTQKVEAHYRGDRHPWQVGQRSYDSEFVDYMAKQLPADDRMNPKLKARNYITNCQNSEGGTQKLYDAWEIYQEERQRREEQQRAIASSNSMPVAPPLQRQPDSDALEGRRKFREMAEAAKREVGGIKAGGHGSIKTA